MLIRDILEESEKKFSEIKAVRWLKKKEICDRSLSGNYNRSGSSRSS